MKTKGLMVWLLVGAVVPAGALYGYVAWQQRAEPVRSEPAAAHAATLELRFPAGAPQLAYIQARAVEAFPEPLLEPLNGRIVYDENHTARVSSPIAGRVLKIAVEPGARVRAGDVLAVIDAPEYAAAVADLSKAEAELRQKDLAYRRAQELHEGGVIARKDFEAAETDFRQAHAERTRAQRRLDNLTRGGGTADNRYTLRAPIGGVVADRRLNPGTEVRPDQPDPLFVVTDPTHLWVLIDLPERYLGKVSAGQGVEVAVDAYPSERFPGKIANIGEVLDPATRRVQVRCVLDNPRRLLKPEMYARITPLADSQTRLPKIPNAAIISQGLYNFVFVEKEPGVFVKRQIALGLQAREESYVRDGLQPGERVVVAGALLLNSELTSSE